jgi:hypothetical protein
MQLEELGWIYFDRNPEWNAMSASILAYASKVYDWKIESTHYKPFIPLAAFQFSAMLIYTD